jgi:hypothetical protein
MQGDLPLMVLCPKITLIKKNAGFNLIEVALALMFFGISFSALLMGTQSIISANLDSTQMMNENEAINRFFNSVNFYTVDVERRFDITPTRQTLAVQGGKRLFYTLNVYSEPNFSDIKIAELTLYKRPNAEAPVYRRVQRKIDMTNECYNFGGTRPETFAGLNCNPLPATPNIGTVDLIENITTVNRFGSDPTAYTTAADVFPAKLNAFNPEEDNVWGGIQRPAAALVPNQFDTVDAYTDGTILTMANPIARSAYGVSNTTSETASDVCNGAALSTCGIENTPPITPTGINVRLLMPASSDRLGSDITNSAFRYSLEVGARVPTAGHRIRAYPICSNIDELTVGDNGFLEFPRPTAGNNVTIRMDNLRPFYDRVSGRPVVGVGLLVVRINADGTVSRNVAPVNVTYMVKRLYTGL